MSEKQQTTLERLVLMIAAPVIAAGIIWLANEVSSLGEQMARVEERMQPIHTTVQDHETRIRRLERSR